MCQAHLSRAARLPLDWPFVHLHGQDTLFWHAVVLLICLEYLRFVMPPVRFAHDMPAVASLTGVMRQLANAAALAPRVLLCERSLI